MNTNLDGKKNVATSLTTVKGIGLRFSTMVCKAAGIDLKKRCGDLSEEELQRIESILLNPSEHNIPVWAFNRQRDFVDGKTSHVISNLLENKIREDLERLKRTKGNRGLRHAWGIRVRGQHTKTTGRRGRTVGVSKKK